MRKHLENSRKSVEIFDCINNTRAYYLAPPKKEVDRISKVRENYLKMLDT